MSELISKLFAVHDSLTKAGLAHAFGGAIALAYCTEEPRGTRDLDVNIFTDSSRADRALTSLPSGVRVAPNDIKVATRDGQIRLWWDETPIDIFLNNHPFHEIVARGVRWVALSEREIPVLGCTSLVVFKAIFGRTKDWADIEAVAHVSPGEIDQAKSTVAELLGRDDPAYDRLSSLQT